VGETIRVLAKGLVSDGYRYVVIEDGGGIER